MNGELAFVIFYGGCLIGLGIFAEVKLRKEYHLSKNLTTNDEEVKE